MKRKTTLKYLHHILINNAGGAYQKVTEIVNGFLCSIGVWKIEDEVTYQGTEALALDSQDPNKSKAFFELLSLNKI